ncbi:hypothetical protein HZA97_07745 [Candidatus Woesearchaeota archaeon]|nr:hypothetical protein [Candidatus Woesearchaeota archaeon]
MGVLKNLVGSLVLATSFFIPSSVEAQTINSPQRELKIDFNNPITNFEANSNDWYSSDQVVGKGSDYLYKNWKNNFGTRTLALLADNELTHLLKFASHEFGHVRAAKRYGDMTVAYHWNSPFDLNKNFIKLFRYEPDLEQSLDASTAGLNQDEYSSYLTFRNNLDQLSVHDGLSFLMNKWYDDFYILTGPSEEEGGDPDSYIFFLNEKNINLTEGDYFAQAFLADALTMQTYDSIEVVLGYLIDGHSTVKRPTRMYLKNIIVTPPIVNAYLTPEGTFYNMSSIVDALGKNPVELSFATPVNFIGDGKVETYRGGGQVNNLKLGNFKLSPFYYVDTDLSFNHTGYNAGLQINKPLRKNVDLRLKVEHNKKDLLENVVKGEKDGWNAVLGVDIKF